MRNRPRRIPPRWGRFASGDLTSRTGGCTVGRMDTNLDVRHLDTHHELGHPHSIYEAGDRRGVGVEATVWRHPFVGDGTGVGSLRINDVPKHLAVALVIALFESLKAAYPGLAVYAHTCEPPYYERQEFWMHFAPRGCRCCETHPERFNVLVREAKGVGA